MARGSPWAGYLIWGSIAVCAVLAATVTIALVVSMHRGIQIAAPARSPVPPAKQPAPPAPAPAVVSVPDAQALEIARLNDALRALAAERDRLAERLERIEQTLGDITASAGGRAAHDERTPAGEARDGGRSKAAPAAPALDILRPYSSARPPVGEPRPGQAPVQVRALPPAPEPAVTRTEFALDLGAETSLEALRARWAGLRDRHGGALVRLTPLAGLREESGAGLELRLIAGPIADADAAARICAALEARGVPCRTTVFDGQRLTSR